MTVHLLRGPNTGYRDLREDRLFTDYEQMLFSRVVTSGREGRQARRSDGRPLVEPLPGHRPGGSAARLRRDHHRALDGHVAPRAGPAPRRGLGARCRTSRATRCDCACVESEGRVHEFVLGAHPPTLAPSDINLIHELWVGFKDEPAPGQRAPSRRRHARPAAARARGAGRGASRPRPGDVRTEVRRAAGGPLCAGGRELGLLERAYGTGRWRKLTGSALVRLPSGRLRRAEVHWYEAHGIGKKKLKIKRFLD